jgi:hypothetical protein
MSMGNCVYLAQGIREEGFFFLFLIKSGLSNLMCTPGNEHYLFSNL